MARGDFNYIAVNQSFNDSNTVFEKDFQVKLEGGRQRVDDGYLLITARSVDSTNHRIRLNNRDLPGSDIPLPPGNSNAWFTYMVHVPLETSGGQPFLVPGTNELEIRRAGGDNFEVKDMVVHWREEF